MIDINHHVTTTELSVKAIISTILIAFAHWLEQLQNVHLPPICIELAQWFSYMAAGLVGLITIIKYLRDKKPKQ